MLNAIIKLFHTWRRWISRSEWLIRLLHLTRAQDTASEAGLILIQIDGLSRRQMERAMAAGKLPFLAQLLRRHRYKLHSVYSGLPSSTPAMTAELLYGVKCAVPAFSFYDRARESILRMFEAGAAKDMDVRLQGEGPPLLAGGSAYAGIYTGGAAETHFCASTMGLSDLFRARYPLRLFIILLFGIYSLLRVGVLLVIEFFLALLDAIRGLIAGQDLWKEIKFVPSRVGVSILMRELATIGAMIDAARGLPVIYLDFVGYDEQSHRRGPNSRFAHWSLKGIDKAIGRIWRAARRSSQREYDVWVFSDHGSERAIPYPVKYGRTLQAAIGELLEELGESLVGKHEVTGIQSKRMRSYLLHQPAHESHTASGQESKPRGLGRPVVAAMGPVGHLYMGRPLDDEQRRRLARLLVERVQVPMVAVCDGSARALAWTKRGQFVLPEDASLVFGPDHPFLEEMAEDFVTLCRHRNAGDFVLWGWSRDESPVTFPLENGAHAGPGLEETHAFALLPEDAPPHRSGKEYLRPLDLHDMALKHLGRSMERWRSILPATPRDAGLLRVMTYNAHSCMGIDGKISPRRVARVISRFHPDLVALQEVDVGRPRTRRADQAQVIAEYLEMDYCFHPTIWIAEEAYGDCILSRLPMRLVKSDILPSLSDGNSREPRGALWVAVELGEHTIHLVNTHLGLSGRERLLQMQALLGPQWLGRLDHAEPVVLCGDFNASPRSRVWKLCAQRYRDVQMELSDHIPRGTWFSHYPFARIDHIFVNSHLRVVDVDVGSDYLARVASDHRPLVAELRV